MMAYRLLALGLRKKCNGSVEQNIGLRPSLFCIFQLKRTYEMTRTICFVFKRMLCQSIMCLLWRVYFVPLKASQNLKILFSMMIITFVIAAADYDFRPKMPPFESLNVTQGIIDFSDKKPTRGGASLVLIQADSSKLILSCAGGKNNDRDCVRPEMRNKYRGQQARIWWFIHDALLGNYTKLAQLEVDGKIIISYGEQKEIYDGFSYKTMGRIGVFSSVFLIYIFGMPLRYFSNTQTNE